MNALVIFSLEIELAAIKTAPAGQQYIECVIVFSD
jgi:hypothetical protein